MYVTMYVLYMPRQPHSQLTSFYIEKLIAIIIIEIYGLCQGSRRLRTINKVPHYMLGKVYLSLVLN
jgi:hypothetical protein